MTHQWILLIVLIVCCKSLASSSQTYFTGAVYEHARQQGDYPSGVEINLGYYERAAKVAKEQGSDLIVFPEYGIFPPSGERRELKKYLERIPNPKEVSTIPCEESDSTQSPILYSLSCLAKRNNIVVVANMGGLESCNGQGDCPEDGDLHMNANVAFDQNGTLVGRFYKEHLYFEFGMDLPRENQDPTFETNFGKFAMFICFEIIFPKMADFGRRLDVDAVLFSTMWLNSSPFFPSTPWFQAWAMGNNATLLAANIQMPGYLATGSGIYSGREGSIASTLNPDGVSKLIVATIPKRNQSILSTSTITAITENATYSWGNDGKDIPEICSYAILGKSTDIYKDYRCTNENVGNYTLKRLTKAADHIEVCNNGMCCSLNYIASSMDESFYLGVYNGTHIPFLRYAWSEENCFLARCDDLNGTSCSNFAMYSNTFFQKVLLTANFTSQYVYPSLVGSGMRLVPVQSWSYGPEQNNPSIEYNNSSGIPLLLATLKGRAYEKDPQYKQ